MQLGVGREVERRLLDLLHERPEHAAHDTGHREVIPRADLDGAVRVVRRLEHDRRAATMSPSFARVDGETIT